MSAQLLRGVVPAAVALAVALPFIVRAQESRDPRTAQRAERLITGPDVELDRDAPDGGIASGAIMELRWLPTEEVPGTTVTYPAGTSGTGSSELTLPGAGPGGQPLFLGMFIRDFGGLESGDLNGAQGTLDSTSLHAGLSVWRPACPGDDDALCDTLTGTGAGSGCNVAPINDDTCAPAYQDTTRADYHAGDYPGPWGLAGCSIGSDGLVCFVNVLLEPPHLDPGGGGLYLGTFTLVADTALLGGPHPISLIPPDGQTGAVAGNGNPYVVKTVDATVTVPTASCCFDPDQCEEGVTELDCDARPSSIWREDEPLCPENGGYYCCGCLFVGEVDRACADPLGAPFWVSDNQCTINFCDLYCRCTPLPIPNWDPDTECCNPLSGVVTPKADSNECTDDFCTSERLPYPFDGVGVPEHPPSPPGTLCDDDSPCTFACAGSGCTDACTAGDCAAGGPQAGACDGAGDCTGTDVNDIPCTTNEDCAALIAEVACVDGFCSCTEFPNLIITPGDSGLPKDPNCYVDGQKFDVTVSFEDSLEFINGYQITLDWDPACVDLQSVTYLEPWTQVIVEDIDEAAGTMFLAAGVEFGAGDGPKGDADMLVLSFAKTGDCAECQICWGGINPEDTVLTTNEGQPLPPTTDNTCTKPIRTAGDLTLDVPGDAKTNVGCDSVRATVTWDPATASDTCGLQDFVCGGQNESGKDISDRVLAGGEFARGATTFCCWAQNDCGFEKGFKVGVDPNNTAAITEGCWTVQVNDQTTLDISVELSPTMIGGSREVLTRCIEFEAYSNCVQAPIVFHHEMTFGGVFGLLGHYVGEFKSPSGQFACLTARDKLHTLRACALRSDGNLDCVDGTLYATFTGDPFFAGNWLIGGNLDAWKKSNPLASHDTIDIQDFGQFVAQYLNCYRDGAVVACDDPAGINGDTPCPEGGHPDSGHADINGDGRVDLLDFTFVRMNFLEASKDCCCPGSGGSADTARTEISVAELRKAGQHDLTVADLNGDGLVNMDDMAALTAGELPNRKPSHAPLRSSGRK